MEYSKIAWTDHTFNSWMGCTKISEGCAHCYAEAQMDTYLRKVRWGPKGTRVRTSEQYWRKPNAWNKQTWMECLGCGWRGDIRHATNAGTVSVCPDCEGDLKVARQRVFCASLADVFEDNPQVANWRGKLFQLIDQTPNLEWILLTKRADRIFSLGTDAVGEIFDNWLAARPNVWLGVTVENQEATERIEALSRMCANRLFLSIEPMLGAIKLPHLWRSSFWVIVGGESGKGCRPFEWDWARDVRDQCKAAGVPFFMKQGGGYPNKRDELKDIPDDLRIREFPSREGG